MIEREEAFNKISYGSSLLPLKPPYDNNGLDIEGELIVINTSLSLYHCEVYFALKISSYEWTFNCYLRNSDGGAKIPAASS